jgi:hypothetical protein
MSQQELLKRVVQTLDQIGIDYMITGSMASSLQGEPRSTHDIDVVLAIQEIDVDNLVDAFRPPDFFLDSEAIKEAISHHSMFNLIHVHEGDKVDFWILTNEPFDRSRFTRKYVEAVMGLNLKVSSPEDTILMKLRWAMQSGGSEKQFTDALRVFEVQHDKLDLEYLNRWAVDLDVEELWMRVQAEADVGV